MDVFEKVQDCHDHYQSGLITLEEFRNYLTVTYESEEDRKAKWRADASPKLRSLADRLYIIFPGVPTKRQVRGVLKSVKMYRGTDMMEDIFWCTNEVFRLLGGVEE